jgi:hypothetical protein
MLGTVDSLGNQIGLRSKPDEIAQQGKLEIERGLENWKGVPTTASATSPSQSSYGQQAQDTTGGVAGSGGAAPYGFKGDPGPGELEHIIFVAISNLSPTHHKVMPAATSMPMPQQGRTDQVPHTLAIPRS